MSTEGKLLKTNDVNKVELYIAHQTCQSGIPSGYIAYYDWVYLLFLSYNSEVFPRFIYPS